jgi:RNA polymerase sigma-70 factor (ECF subfamily)
MDVEALDRAIAGAQKGDTSCLDRLIESYADRLFGFLYRMTGSRHDAEDLMQEVFVRLVRTISTYQHDGRFEAWFFRIAANLARDRLRRIRRGPKFLSVSLGTDDDERAGDSGGIARIGAEVEPVDAAIQRAEEMDALGAAMLKLPDAEREVVMLRHFSQLSFREIAETTGVPLGTALARGHRGLGKLRAIMTAGHSDTDSACDETVGAEE